MERSADWIYEAGRDLEHAKSDSNSGFYNWACFSAQQGAEKALRAVFQKMGAEAWGAFCSRAAQRAGRESKDITRA